MNLRCFIAIEIPEPQKKSIKNIIDILIKSGADIKWVSTENIHITLKFLGQTDESLITSIKEALYKKLLPYNSFYIKISGIGCFPDVRRPRVIWVDVEKSETLTNLQKEIDNEIVKFGYSIEKRDFSPHLTIGRVKSQKGVTEMIKILNEFSTFSFGNIEIKNITLMKSELKPAGAEYQTLAEIPFGRRNDVK